MRRAGRPVAGIVPLIVVTLVVMALPAGAGSGIPFRATMAGTDVTFDPNIPADRCPEMAEAGLRVDSLSTFTGSGHGTHLGLFEATAQHCSNMATGIYMDGILTVTAANGDTLVGTYTGGASDVTNLPEISFEDAFTFTDGGTGRFATASGEGVEAGTFNLGTNEFSLVMEGWIAYKR